LRRRRNHEKTKQKSSRSQEEGFLLYNERKKYYNYTQLHYTTQNHRALLSWKDNYKMKCDVLFKTIDNLKEKYVDILEDVCNIESPTDFKDGVDAVGRYFINIAKDKGWDIDVCSQEVSGDAICITVNPKAKKPPIALSGHMDTVHPVGSFGEQPVVRRENGRMYGPGTTDCKGGIAAMFLAADALCQCGFEDRPILLLLQSDEEKSSMPSGKATIKYICDKAEGSDAFLNAEAIYKNTAVLVRKGIMRLKLTVYGAAAHSAMCYNGVNAIAEAAHKIIELEKMKDPDGLTCNCGMINGGSAPNVVPEKCEFIADIRFATLEEMNKAREIVKSVADKVFVEGCRCEVQDVSYRPPMERSEKNEALLKRMNLIFKENELPELTGVFANGGSDAAYVTARGIPCVDSIAVRGGLTHSRGEYVEIDSISEAAKRIASVVYCF